MWLSLSKDQVLQLLLTATAVEFFSLLAIDIPSLLLLAGSREFQVHSFPHVATKWVMRWYLLHPSTVDAPWQWELQLYPQDPSQYSAHSRCSIFIARE